MARAEAKMIRISSRKVRLVIDLVRGKKVGDAFNILEYTNKAATPVVKKLIQSAVANAVNNDGNDASKLVITEIYSNEGPTMKRFNARAHGRAFSILKRTSHIVAVVEEK